MALAEKYCRLMHDLEAAALEITGELNRDGSPAAPGDGSFTSDALYDYNSDADQLLQKLGLRVESGVVLIKNPPNFQLTWVMDADGIFANLPVGGRYEIVARSDISSMGGRSYRGQFVPTAPGKDVVLVGKEREDIALAQADCQRHFDETQPTQETKL